MREHLSQANGLLDLDIERVSLYSFLEEAKQIFRHLSFVIHGDVGCGNMDNILHVLEGTLG